MKREDNDLFQLCQAIISCGELSEDSIRQLSEYINNSPNASESWPGNLLIKPLQKVWKDGVVDESELESLLELLESIVQPVSRKQPSVEKQIAATQSEKRQKRNRRETDSLSTRNFGFVLLAVVVIVISEVSGCGRRKRRRGFWWRIIDSE